jgi:hypothetical protein
MLEVLEGKSDWKYLKKNPKFITHEKNNTIKNPKTFKV